MPFDAEAVFHDGTAITADISPTSTTRASGSAVIDLQKTPVKGLSAVMAMNGDLAEASDTLQVSIEECATVDGTYVELARFPLITKGTGYEAKYVVRFQTNKQYVRAKINVTDADSGSDFTVSSVHILLAPHEYMI